MSRTKTASVVALLVFAPGVLCAEQYSFRYFGIAEGLTNLAVRQIFQDRTGFIWVSTENGVFRFDGERFEPFGPERGLPPTSGAAFGDAPDGSLLVGGDFGLYALSGNDFHKVPIPAKSVNWAHGIEADGRGHTYLGTDSGLIELSSKSSTGRFEVRQFPRPEGSSDIGAYGVSIDGDVLWYGCGQQVCRVDSRGTTVLGRECGLPSHEWLVIRKDPEGNLWVRGKNAGVLFLAPGRKRFQRPASPVDPSSMVGVPSMDEDGRMLFPTPVGLLIRDQTGWQTINRSVGLRGTVYAAFEDRQHCLWIGLAGRGLARWQGYRKWESYTVETGLASDIVYEIAPAADGSLWVASEGGLFQGLRRDGRIASWKKFEGIGEIQVHSLQTDPDGDLWIGTETHGAARIHRKDGSIEWFGEEQGLAGKAPYTLRFDRKQTLWAATEAGLFAASPPYRTFSRIAALPSSRFWTVEEGADGTIWAGGARGLFSYSNGHWRNFTRADGLSNLEVISLGAGPKGEVWIGYRFGGGIDRIRLVSGGATIDKGLQRIGTDGIVYFLRFDALGKLWTGTERGVDVWDGSRWSHFDTSDGLAWDDCNLNAFAAGNDGTVWIGTSGGLSHYHPRDYPSLDAPPEVVFTKVLLGRTEVSGQRNPAVGIDSNSFTARFSALNCPRESAIVFRYRLAEQTERWTETTQRELQFAELQPGSYRLEIQARDSDGTWSGPLARFTFSVRTPWYRSWRFLGACGLIPVSLVIFVLRLRMGAAKQRERELVRLVDEKTVDLRRANEDLLRLSSLDPLTGLANRRIFDQALARECACLNRTDARVSLLMLDVDHFKALNDSRGHPCGDEYLVMVGEELRRVARRQVDVTARYGGEEFAVILPGLGSGDAIQFAESLRLAIAGLRLPHPVGGILTVSIGVATATHDWCMSPEQLLAAADQALFRGKRDGRNQVVAAEPVRMQGLVLL